MTCPTRRQASQFYVREIVEIGLVSYRCENGNIFFNLSRIERALREAQGKAELLCFGEAFLQGFDSLCWGYEIDRAMAEELSSETIRQLCRLTVQYGIALLVGYFEKKRECVYSSCAVLAHGAIVHNYGRISGGWKERSKTDYRYCEGLRRDNSGFMERRCCCPSAETYGSIPERFKTEHLLIWPVYVNFTPTEGENGVLNAYAAQASLAAQDALMINPIDTEPCNHGGSFRFQHEVLTDRILFDEEGILIVDVG